MRHVLKSAAIALACAGGMVATTNTFAANWLTLQGTEPESAAPRVKLWGFLQAQYQKDNSDPAPNGNLIPPKLIGPNVTSQEAFNVNRARIGFRGTGMPIDPKVNYFMLLELGNNAITAANDGSTFITDVSVTMNQFHAKGARVRMGLFKAPMTEEGLQAIHVFDYINFTTMSNQLMLERFPNSAYTANAVNTAGVLPINTSTGGLNQFDKPVGAFRDVGIQIFDAFKKGDWEHSYAFMIGNGNGLNFSDSDDNKDTYVYFSTEKVYGGKGARRQGMKVFAWSQNGKRLLDNTAGDGHNPVEFDRTRTGAGFKYLKKPWRASFEYMQGEGMIFVGPDKPEFDQNGALPNADGTKGEASGWYMDAGYYLPKTNWQFDLRYDTYVRLKGDTKFAGGPNIGRNFESEWATITLGVNYHFNKKSRITINYSDTNVETPSFPAGVGPNAQMDGVGSRYALQVTHIF